MKLTAKYEEVLAAAKELAAEQPENVTQHLLYKFTHDTVNNPTPYDLMGHLFAKFNVTPEAEWLWTNNHRVSRVWLNDVVTDWAVQVFLSRIERAQDNGLTWKKAVERAERQTLQYYRAPAMQLMIELMMRDYPDSSRPAQP